MLPLIAHDEFHAYGVDDLLEAYRQPGLHGRRQPIVDPRVCSLSEMQELVRWMRENLDRSAGIVLNCVGGQGRSGVVAACYLRAQGLDANATIAEVRRTRSPRAVESAVQEEFIYHFVTAG